MTTHRPEAVVLVLNHLLVVGRATASPDPAEVEISLPAFWQVAPVQASFRYEIIERKPRRSAPAGETGFIVVCPLDFEFAKQVSAQPIVSIGLRADRRNVGRGTLAVSSLLDPEMLAHSDSIRLMCLEAGTSHPLFFRLVASILDGDQKSPTIATHLDYQLIVPDVAFVASGWAEGVSEHNVAFVLDEFKLAVNPERVLTKPGELGFSQSRFTCVDTAVGTSRELRLAATSGSTIRWSQVMELRDQGGPRAFLQVASRSLSLRDSLYLISSSDVLQRVLQARSEPHATEVMAQDDDPARTPDISIVIPFYGDDFFLLDHLESQRRTDLHAEWIFVCDDPALLPSMVEEWRGRGAVKPSRLISLSENGGYAKANNLAFVRARADIIAFMNSDIYWSSLAPLEYGAKLLRDDEEIGMVGFTLRYEDGTLQHAGMHLTLVPDHDDLLHWMHPGKGLPAKDFGTAISAREVEAVTGALILVRRKDFDTSVFDEGYVGGDYEDGDLCLTMRARGKKIMLVECDGLFHLERQSIRLEPTHEMISAVNCARFNRKWTSEGLPRLDSRSQATGAETPAENSQSQLAASTAMAGPAK